MHLMERDHPILNPKKLRPSRPTLELHKLLFQFTIPNQATKLRLLITQPHITKISLQITKLHYLIVPIFNQVIKFRLLIIQQHITEMSILTTKLHNTQIIKHQHLITKILQTIA